MTPILITGNSSAASTAAYASAVGAATPGTTLFVLAATVPGDSLAHKVIITPSASVTGNYIITGTAPNGEPQSETLATSTTAAVTSAKYYLTLVSIKSPSGLSTNNVDIGFTTAAVSPWAYLIENWTLAGFGFGCSVDSGSPTYSVQFCFEASTAFTHATVTAKTDSQAHSIAYPVRAVRLLWSAAGAVTLRGYY